MEFTITQEWPKTFAAMEFKLDDLKEITYNFAPERKVRSGGHGNVYRGVYYGKETAVKRFRPMLCLERTPKPGFFWLKQHKEFKNEVRNLERVDHQNVVKLVGYCYESINRAIEHNGEIIFSRSIERLLCFEYIRFGSLGAYITDVSCCFDWTTCYQIIKGTCDGINHLHTAYKKPIFHLELKPDYILLDKDQKAKIADFGLSELAATDENFREESLKETPEYIPPEYMNLGLVSDKYDVYSLGVIIIKLMDGNQGLTHYKEMGSSEQFIEQVCKKWNKKLMNGPGEGILQLQVKKCVEVAIQCVVNDHNQRPSIKNIVDELEELEAEIKKLSRELEAEIKKLPPPSNNESKEWWSKPAARVDFKLHVLQEITYDFSPRHKVGSGAYGHVYRGVYKGKEIAVKRFHPWVGLDDKEFYNEVANIINVNHQNVVKLLGYCYQSNKQFVGQKDQKPNFAESNERILCFEYMQGGSLDKHITEASCDFDWSTCYQIIKGICYGIHHLHTAYNNPIFHLDLKPENILLDKNKNAKIADFGLSKLDAATKTYKTVNLKGTLGYMPLEYLQWGIVSDKYDVFSLGVIIIKLMDGNKGLTRYAERRSSEQFIEHVCGKWNKNLSKVPGEESLQVKKCVEIALRCVVDDRNQRPSIKDIVDEMEQLGS